MDTLKAILNQILLFFDDVGAKVKRLPAKGRRRLFLLAAIFLLLVILLMILCVSSCHSGDAATAQTLEASARNRVRATVNSLFTASPWGEDVRISSGVFPVNDPVLSTPRETRYSQDEPTAVPTDEPYAEPTDEPEETPEPDVIEETPEPDVIEEDTPEPTEEVPEETPEPTVQYATLKKHDKSEAVNTLQYRLMELGYLDIDEPTNYFGTSTESALILFQRQHDLKQDGVAGNETQTILFSEGAEHYCMKEGAEGQDVKALQEQLVDLGYLDADQVDRVYGPVTIAAVQAFQKRNNLHADGLAGEKTLELLYSDSAKMSREMQKKLEAEAAAEKKAEEEARKKAEEEAKKKAAEEAAKKKAEEEAKKKAEAEAKKKAEEAAKKKKATATPKKGSKTTSKATTKKTATPKPTPKPTPTPTPTPKRDLRIDKFINAASSKIGCEYVLGGRGPSKFDCSGLIYWCLKQAGVGGTRLNAAGYSMKSGWKKIDSINDLKRGDILFFRSDTNKSVNHTGIYVGGGNMIDASSGNGKVVKRALSAYWKRNFVCARRPWNE